MTPVPFEIMSFLIIEEDVGRLMGLAEAFTESRIYNKLVGLPTGKAALDYLGAGAQNPNKIAADVLIFSDAMPDISWRELVQAVQAKPDLEQLRLVLMTNQSVKEIITGEMGRAIDLVLPREIRANELLASLHKIPGSWCSFVRPKANQSIKAQSRTLDISAPPQPQPTTLCNDGVAIAAM